MRGGGQWRTLRDNDMTPHKAINATTLQAALANGGEVRQGTALRSAFPVWEWQLFDSNGQFVAPIQRAALIEWTQAGGTISTRRGLNR